MNENMTTQELAAYHLAQAVAALAQLADTAPKALLFAQTAALWVAVEIPPAAA